MEQFTLLKGDTTLKASREQINNALSTVRSLSSGIAVPTPDLVEGMLCYRTDHGRLYQLVDAENVVWTDRIAMSITGTASTADAVSCEGQSNTVQSNPTCMQISGRKLPTTVPGNDGFSKIRVGIPSLSRISL